MIGLVIIILIAMSLFKTSAKLMKVFSTILVMSMIWIGIENVAAKFAKTMLPVLFAAGIISFIIAVVAGVMFVLSKSPSVRLMVALIACPLISSFAVLAAPGGTSNFPLVIFIAFMFSGVWVDSAMMISHVGAGEKLTGSRKLRAMTAGPQLAVILSIVVVALVHAFTI